MLSKVIKNTQIKNQISHKFGASFSTSSQAELNTNEQGIEAISKLALRNYQQSPREQNDQKQQAKSVKVVSNEVFLQNMEKLRIFEQKNEKILQKALQEFKTQSILSPAPMKNILKIFQSASKHGFDQKLLTQTFEYLAKTHQSFPEISVQYGDYTLKDVHNSWRFLDMIEDIKYGLKSGVQFDVENISSILKSLAQLEYKNHELQTLALEKLERISNNTDNNFEVNYNDLSQNPQAHKKHYYPTSLTDSQVLLAQNQLFQSQLNTLMEQQQQNQVQQEQNVQQQQQQQQQSKEDENDIQEVNNLISDIEQIIQNSSTNILEIAQSIVALRQQYFKLLQVNNQNNSNSGENSHFNLQLLELEESLIQHGFISLEEIENPENIINNFDNNARNVAEILKQYLSGNNDNMTQYFDTFLQNTQNAQPQQQLKQVENVQQNQEIQENTELQNQKLATALLQICNVAQLRRQDATGENYISKSWENKLSQKKNQLSQLDQDYFGEECDRIYTKAYQVTLQKFQSMLPNLLENQFKNETNLNTLSSLQAACLRIGTTAPAKQILNQINSNINNLPEQLKNLNNSDFQQVLNNLVFLKQYHSEAQNIVKLVTEEISTRSDKFLYLDEQLDSMEFLYVSAENLETLFNNKNSLFKTLLTQLSQNLQNFDLMTAINESTQQKLSTLALLVNSYPQQFKEIAPEQLFTSLSGISNTYSLEKNVSPVRERIVEFLQSNNPSQKNQFQELDDVVLSTLPPFFKPDYSTYKLNQGKLVRNGIYLLDSQYISMDENIVDGRVQFWQQVLKDKYKIEASFVRYMGIQENTLQTYNTDLLLRLTAPKQQIVPTEIQYTILDTILTTSSEKDRVFVTEIDRIFDRIDILQSKIEGGVEIMALSALEEIKYSLYELTQILKKLSEQTQTSLQTSLNNNDLEVIFKQIAKNLDEQVGNSQVQKGQVNQSLNNYSFMGKRLTSELLKNNNTQNQQQQNQINTLNYLNLQQLQKKGYHDYQDWTEILQSEVNVGNLMSTEVKSQFAGIFQSEESQFQDKNQNKPQLNDDARVYVIPSKKVDRFIIRPLSYPLNWEAFYLEGENQNQKKLQNIDLLLKNETVNNENNSKISSKISENTKFIANLQNFKYELKNSSSNSLTQIPDLLVKFDFIPQLAASLVETVKEGKSNSNIAEDQVFNKIIPRNGEEFFNYLELSSTQEMYNSQFVEYFMKKVQQKQKIISLWNLKNKSYLQEQYKLLKKGKISRKAFENIKQNINDELLSELKTLDQNSKEEVLLQGPSRKFVDIKFDIQSLIQDKQGNNYSRYQDIDFQAAQGDTQNALNIKRFRAELNTVKLAILAKSQQNLLLSESEQSFVKLWLSGEFEKIQLYNNEGQLKQLYSLRALKTISENDKDLLKNFKFSDLSDFPEYPLNDLVFEFSQLLNQSLVTDFDFKIKEQQLQKDWNINTELLNNFQTTDNGNHWVREAENLAWNKGQELNEQELQDLSEMLTILKDKTPVQREILKKSSVQDASSFSLFNQLKSRLPLIEKYINLREEESKNTQLDLGAYKEKESVKINVLWEKTFQKTYESTSEQQLHVFVNNILQRFHLLSKFPPASFSNFLIKLISHPKLNKIDRDMLVAFLNVFEPELKFDSQDIIQIAQNNVKNIENGRNIQEQQGYIKNQVKNAGIFPHQQLFEQLSK